jgi:hypothetical protein
MSAIKYLAMSGLLLAGCLGGPGDPGLKFVISNRCDSDIEYKVFRAGLGDRWLPIGANTTTGFAGADVKPNAYVFAVRWLDGSGERRFSPENAVVELSGDRCPKR